MKNKEKYASKEKEKQKKKKKDNYSKPICGMAHFHFAYPWFKTLHFAHLNFNPLPIHYPPLLKSRIKMYFIFTFMSLSSKNKK